MKLNRLTALTLGVISTATLTLAACNGSDSAPLVPSSQPGGNASNSTPLLPSSQPGDNCTISMTSLITTSKGSKDVRNELNEMFRQMMCRTSELDAEVVKADSSRNLERDRNKAAYKDCLASEGLTEEDAAKSAEEPCLEEFLASLPDGSSPSNKPRTDLEWTLHDAWLNSWQMIYNLAKIYPDSVQPSFLSYIIGWGEYVETCSGKPQWCQPEKN
jgi:hypothetical protein